MSEVIGEVANLADKKTHTQRYVQDTLVFNTVDCLSIQNRLMPCPVSKMSVFIEKI